MPLLVKQFEPDLPHGALCTLIQDHTAITHVMQAITVAASSPNKFEVEDVALGGRVLVELARGNPLLNGQEVIAGFQGGTFQKA